MANLPSYRVQNVRPFYTTGLDFAGPILLRTSKGRGHKSYKAYICVFVCLATRAIHLEPVSDLTSQGFIAAYKRFTSRRGLCQTILSDNGKNFVGASKELQSMFNAASEFYKESITSLSNLGTDWVFIPPHAPHFGGIWEAGVKSVKHHLRRVIGETTLTFEEMSTLLCQIEACLNSRPICQLSTHSHDFSSLTPGHFLIGHAISVLPEPGVVDTNISPILRFKLITKMRNDFWNRWSREYLHTLQQRNKWTVEKPNLQLGQLVLVKDDNLPPAQWPLAKISELHPDKHGHVRVVSLKTAKGTFKRPIVKLCPLPIIKE